MKKTKFLRFFFKSVEQLIEYSFLYEEMNILFSFIHNNTSKKYSYFNKDVVSREIDEFSYILTEKNKAKRFLLLNRLKWYIYSRADIYSIPNVFSGLEEDDIKKMFIDIYLTEGFEVICDPDE